ncbi:FAD-dependent oxidoreductase [Actinokineospora soli]|uniref:FAD-dependent oxidoreductase n=1 Tax=Actinokineospora soli TaxID=1048753 RepID=A0ABW2TMJ4_9PSEU
MQTTTARRSLWLDGVSPTLFPTCADSEDVRFDAVVVGGGITGLTTALLLKRAGMKVAVVEADQVGRGVTGNNTAKVTALQSTVYSELERLHSEETAAGYAAASVAGVELVAELAAEVDCDVERRPAHTVAMRPEDVGTVEAELAAAVRAGLPAVADPGPDLPFPVHAAVRLDDQIRLHPLRYAIGLARLVDGGGCRVFERSRVQQVREGRPATVHTEHGDLLGGHVVIATHYPILDRGLYFARLEPMRSYCVAATLRGGAPPASMAISTGGEVWSISSAGDRLIVGGQGHHVAERGDSAARYVALEAFAREHWPVAEITHRWSAQDPAPYDRLPMIGSYRPGASTLHVATGFAKWGLSTGSYAGSLLADRILGRQTTDLFSPHRVTPRGIGTLARINAKVGVDLVTDHLAPTGATNLDQLAPGQACVRRDGLGKTGVYRDADGELHAVSLRCTHLGCMVRFNTAEHSWDCPCHGSRFDVGGAVLEGPATKPLDKRAP